jgi:hypothetical protein
MVIVVEDCSVSSDVPWQATAILHCPSLISHVMPSILSSAGLMNRICSQHHASSKLKILTSLPFGSLACSFPGALEAGTPVEVIRRSSGQSAFSSLPSASFQFLSPFSFKWDVDYSRDHIKGPIVNVQLFKHGPSRLVPCHRCRDSLQFIILSFLHSSIPPASIIQIIRPFCQTRSTNSISPNALCVIPLPWHL